MKIREASKLTSATGAELMPASSEVEGDVSVSVEQIADFALDKNSTGSVTPSKVVGILVRKDDGSHVFLNASDLNGLVSTYAGKTTVSDIEDATAFVASGSSKLSVVKAADLYEFIRERMANGGIAFDGASTVAQLPDDASFLAKDRDGYAIAVPVTILTQAVAQECDDRILNADESNTPTDSASVIIVDAGSIRALPLSTLREYTDAVQKTGTTTDGHIATWTPSGKITDGPEIVSDLAGDDGGVPTVGAVNAAFGIRVQHSLISGEDKRIQDSVSIRFLMPDGWDGDVSTTRLRLIFSGDGSVDSGTGRMILDLYSPGNELQHSTSVSASLKGENRASVITAPLIGVTKQNGVMTLTITPSFADYSGVVTIHSIELECCVSMAGGEAWE